MAHQLNFALKEINSIEQQDVFIVVYNADSRPDPRTFSYVFSQKSDNKKVFQQYGDYTYNIDHFKNNILIKSILTSSSSWQNRWSLGIELFRAIFNLKNIHIFKPLSYCIGHGLFIKLSTINHIGGFSEKTYNEDLFLGYTLNNLEKNIYPIPYFDHSESPDTIYSLFIQKSNWFFGPVQFYDYYKILIDKKLYTNKNMLFLYTLKVMFLSVSWIFGPTLLFSLLCYSIYSINYLIYYIILYLLFLVIPNYYSVININKLHINKPYNKLTLFIQIFVGAQFAYFLHGLSGWFGLFKYLKSKITNKYDIKQKTHIIR